MGFYSGHPPMNFNFRRNWSYIFGSLLVAAALSCSPALTRPAHLAASEVAGCYMLSEGAWRTDSVANSFFDMKSVPSEIKLLSTKLVGWEELQSDSLPLFAVDTRERGVMRGSPFGFWQRRRVQSDSIYVGQPLPTGGVRLNLTPIGSDLQGTLTAFTDSPLANRPDEASFPITLRRIECG